MPFIVFDTTENLGSRADRRESLRTVCMVHLPYALPDVRLRIHGRDLIFTGIPGADASMPTHEAMPVVAGLVAIARALPTDVIQRYGQRPATDVPYAKGQDGSLSWTQT